MSIIYGFYVCYVLSLSGSPIKSGMTGGDSGMTGGDSGVTGGDSGMTYGDSGVTGGDPFMVFEVPQGVLTLRLIQ